MATFMKHTKYSDWVILDAVERYHTNGHFDTIGDAFQHAANELSGRKSQIASRYYQLKKTGIEFDDVEDWQEADRDMFHPGDGEPITREYPNGRTRGLSPEGYDKRNIKAEDDEDKDDGVKFETKEYNEEIMSAIRHLITKLPHDRKLDLMLELVQQI